MVTLAGGDDDDIDRGVGPADRGAGGGCGEHDVVAVDQDALVAGAADLDQQGLALVAFGERLGEGVAGSAVDRNGLDGIPSGGGIDCKCQRTGRKRGRITDFHDCLPCFITPVLAGR